MLAAAIDLLVVATIGALVALASIAAMFLQVNPIERDPTAGEWAVGYAVGLLWFPLSSLYVGLGARTIGARLLRLRELRSGPRSFVIRAVTWWPSVLLLAIGMWWPWIDPKGRSLADMLSGSVLLETSER